MAIRIMELRRVLKPTGSIYLHCDPTANSYLRLLMDALFGKNNHRNEIVWCYTGPGSPSLRQFNRKHDTIYWYSAGEQWVFNADAVRMNHHGKTLANFKKGLRGSGFVEGKYELAKGKVPETWWAQEKGNGLAIAARHKSQYVGYPTQKPLALLQRIIKASSNTGDMVLDPFCGCATACIAAEMEEREWVGIDISPKAAELVERRMVKEVGVLYAGIHREDIPQRTDMGLMLAYNDIRNKKHLYGEQGGYCNGCETHFQLRYFEVDHIIPKAKGGTDHISNLQLLCSPCNKLKGTRSHEELLVLLTDKGWIKRKMAA